QHPPLSPYTPLFRSSLTGTLSARSYGAALEFAAFAFGQAAPDAEALIMLEGVLQALGPHLAGGAHSLGVTRGTALLREECFRVRSEERTSEPQSRSA